MPFPARSHRTRNHREIADLEMMLPGALGAAGNGMEQAVKPRHRFEPSATSYAAFLHRLGDARAVFGWKLEF